MRNTPGMAGGLAKDALDLLDYLAGAMGPTGWAAAAAGRAAPGLHETQRNDKRNENLQSGNVLREAEKVAASLLRRGAQVRCPGGPTDAVTNLFQSLTNALAPDGEGSSTSPLGRVRADQGPGQAQRRPELPELPDRPADQRQPAPTPGHLRDHRHLRQHQEQGQSRHRSHRPEGRGVGCRDQQDHGPAQGCWGPGAMIGTAPVVDG